MAAFEYIIVENKGPVGVITLNRPKMLNALSFGVFREIAAAVDDLESDDAIGCILITGNEKAFAAGADIKEMADKPYIDAFLNNFGANEDAIARARKPTVAAVAGFALGGGCEFAMQCDLIIAADNARFGQPEIKLAVTPGMGGSQRLAHAVGKAKAMEMCLTGRMMDAAEAERSGLVSRVVPAAGLIEEALKVAKGIAALSRPAVMMTKETVNRAYETTLSEGIRFERRVFHSMFSLADKKEGMSAFAEKRAPAFKGR